MRYLLLVFVLFNCDRNNSRSPDVTQQDARQVKSKAEMPGKNDLLGIWTDGSGPNASFRIDDDSIYNVEHFTMTKYTYEDGEIKFYYEDEVLSSKVSLLHTDTLVFADKYGTTKYWRFTE